MSIWQKFLRLIRINPMKISPPQPPEKSGLVPKPAPWPEFNFHSVYGPNGTDGQHPRKRVTHDDIIRYINRPIPPRHPHTVIRCAAQSDLRSQPLVSDTSFVSALVAAEIAADRQMDDWGKSSITPGGGEFGGSGASGSWDAPSSSDTSCSVSTD